MPKCQKKAISPSLYVRRQLGPIRHLVSLDLLCACVLVTGVKLKCGMQRANSQGHTSSAAPASLHAKQT